MVLVQSEMQSASSRIWTRFAVSISYDDNHYPTDRNKCTRYGSKIWNNFKRFFFLVWKKKRDKSRFSWLALLFKHFLNKKSAQYEWGNKRNDKESMICITPKPSQSFLIYRIQSNEKCFTEKEIFKEKGLNKKTKRMFLYSLGYGD